MSKLLLENPPMRKNPFEDLPRLATVRGSLSALAAFYAGGGLASANRIMSDAVASKNVWADGLLPMAENKMRAAIDGYYARKASKEDIGALDGTMHQASLFVPAALRLLLGSFSDKYLRRYAVKQYERAGTSSAAVRVIAKDWYALPSGIKYGLAASAALDAIAQAMLVQKVRKLANVSIESIKASQASDDQLSSEQIASLKAQVITAGILQLNGTVIDDSTLGGYVRAVDVAKQGLARKVQALRKPKVGDYLTRGKKLGDYATSGSRRQLGDYATGGNRIQLSDYATSGNGHRITTSLSV